jgi:hypothetical protein
MKMNIQDKKVTVFDEYGACIKKITLADLEYTGLSYTLHYINHLLLLCNNLVTQIQLEEYIPT